MNLSHFNIEAVYGCVGSLEKDNAEACRGLYGDKVDTIIKTTGFIKRRVAAPGVSSLDLCCAAASRLLADLAVNPDDIGAVIAVTFTPELLMPGNACGAQERLGLPKSVLAFDIGLACSGYAYGLYVAGLLAQNLGKKVLLLDGDIQTAYLSGLDKATEPVMADAGSATLVNAETPNPWTFRFLTDGSLRNVLCIPHGGSRHPVDAASLELKEYPDGSFRRDSEIVMDGFEVFKFVSTQATGLIKTLMTEENLTPAEIDAFVPHQANIYMVTQMAKRLKIPVDKLMLSGDMLGNSCSATVPVTMAYNAERGKFTGGRTLLSGFGGGMSVSVGYGVIADSCRCRMVPFA